MDKTRSSKAHAVFAAFVILLTVVTTFFILRGVTSAAAPSIIDASKNNPATVPAASCWLTVPSPNPANSNSSGLQGITAISTDDVWAVGYSGITSTISALIEHWDGSAWNIVPTANLGTSGSYLVAVDAHTADDIWAVGGAGSGPLAVHWNGMQWSKVRIQLPAGYGEGLTSVTAISANDAWAVGRLYPRQATMLHWDGRQWSSVSFPDGASLAGVSGIASNDVWAVGYNTVIHWDGAHWRTVAVPEPPTGWCDNHWGSFLNSVSESAPNDVWSAGYCFSYGAGVAYPLILHWDGAQWTYYPVHLNYALNVQLTSIDAIASDDAWAVGFGNNNTPNFITQPVAIHWDGTQWAQVDPPQQGIVPDSLAGVAIANNDAWVVGYYKDTLGGPTLTLVQRYYPSCPITPTPIATSTPVSPPCPGEQFTDVCSDDYFYTATLALADDGILSGYNTVPPCNNSLWIPCFKPYNSSTRGQISKVVSLATGFNEPVSGQTFEDVPPGSTFYTYTERMAERNIISGYPCGGSGEPCVPPDNKPYFRTNNNVTRGQLSKMVALAFEWNDPPVGQDFEDVPPGSTFYTYVAQLHNRSIIQGYPCGGSGEPCVPPANLPYFRPNSNVLRGQTAKIVELARTPSTPTATPTPTATLTAVPTMTATSVPITTTLPVPTDTPAPKVTATTTAIDTASSTTR